MTISRTRATPPPMTQANRLFSEDLGVSYRWQENSEVVLCPALFTASTHTFVPTSKDPTTPRRWASPKSKDISFPSNTTLYPETTEDGAHHCTSTFPLLSPSVIGSSAWMRGEWGGVSAALNPGHRHPVLAEVCAQGSWFSKQKLYLQISWWRRGTFLGEITSVRGEILSPKLSSSPSSLSEPKPNMSRGIVMGEEVEAARMKRWFWRSGEAIRKRNSAARFLHSEAIPRDRKNKWQILDIKK